MKQDDHTLIYEARAHVQGLSHMLTNMEDRPLEDLHPFEMKLMLQPIIDNLTQVLDEGGGDR